VRETMKLFFQQMQQQSTFLHNLQNWPPLWEEDKWSPCCPTNSNKEFVVSRRTQWSFAFPTICNKKSVVNQRMPLSEFFQQIATRNPLWAEEHNGACFSNCNKRTWALYSFTIVCGSLGVCKSKCPLHYLFMSQVQQASFGSRDPNAKIWGTPSREFNKILAFHCWNGHDFQIILSTKCKICAWSLKEQKRALWKWRNPLPNEFWKWKLGNFCGLGTFSKHLMSIP
jgi:hypothetical protein